MIRVTVELVPHGDERAKNTLGVIEVVNDGTGDMHTGNYDVTGTFHKGDGGYQLTARVEGHRRAGG